MILEVLRKNIIFAEKTTHQDCPETRIKSGGAERSRTALDGFAIRCITALLLRLSKNKRRVKHYGRFWAGSQGWRRNHDEIVVRPCAGCIYETVARRISGRKDWHEDRLLRLFVVLADPLRIILADLYRIFQCFRQMLAQMLLRQRGFMLRDGLRNQLVFLDNAFQFP